MKKILIPTDFSENSWNAIKYASKLFKNDNCTFYLMHAYTPAYYHVEYTFVEPAQFDMYDYVKENALKNLEKIKTRIDTEIDNKKHKIETIAAFNDLNSEIKHLVKKKKIDFIVMGTKGATGAKEILFGSNTVHVIKNVACPVLAIPNEFTFETPYEVLFPTDFNIEYQAHHIKPITDILSPYNSRINIIHATYGYELSELQKENKELLDKYFVGTTHLFHLVDNQTVEECIDNFQLKFKINLLVIINNKHSFFENLFFKSTINHIGFHLKIPFLIIPGKN